MKLTRRTMLTAAPAAPAAAALSTCAATALAAGVAATPEDFGGKGDGRTNDSAAFAALAAHINARGGGEIVLRPTTYIIGRQVHGGGGGDGYAYEPVPLLTLENCSKPIVIRGHGAVLRCAPGLRYGAFDRDSGAAVHRAMPNFNIRDLATPYRAMIRIEHCVGAIDISDLELDGNIGSHRIGGQYGDTGWQIPATGIALVNNRGRERLVRVHSHHHGLDGLLIDGLDALRAGPRASIEQFRADHNGRQGCSLVGGRGYDFRSCRFTDTGRAGLASSPGSGVDIEAEAGKKVRDLSFVDCQFSNNEGPGLVADSGDSEGATFTRCTFIGTTIWAPWPNKPRFRFADCRFVGPIVHTFGDADPDRATQFHACTFLDDPALSPTGQVYGGENPDRPIADLPGNRNTLFDRCRFLLSHRAVLPWSIDVIYANCIMRQVAKRDSYPRGRFVGTTVITGRAQIPYSRIEGSVILNGRTFGPGRV